MIIFDLDGTLADCEHRRHLITPNESHGFEELYEFKQDWNPKAPVGHGHWYHKFNGSKWHPDWKAFYEACNEDTPIWPVVRIMESLRLNSITMKDCDIQIWSGRCESVREKTEHWLKYIVGQHTYSVLKMRPIGDSTPDEELKERWLDEYNLNLYPQLEIADPSNPMSGTQYKRNDPITMVFDDRPKVLRMWQRRGIFTFDVGQGKGEF